MFEQGVGKEEAMAAVRILTAEGIPHGIFRCDQFDLVDVFGRPLAGAAPVATLYSVNAYTNAGGALALDLIAGAGGTAFNAANAYIGVGDSSTANNVTFTDLQAATNKLRVAMDSTFPSRSSQVMTWKSTFTTGQANYAWQETAIFNAGAAGTMLCRTVTSFGTKTSAAAWTMTYTITVP